jgi:RNA polymerase sigma-70 factor (ECF subfamily)
VSLPSDRPDAELVSKAAGGDEAAFAALVRRHERRVYNLAYRMLGREEDARDATQDVFLSCYRRLPSFRGEAAFTTWLHRVTVNAAYDILRRRRGTVLGQDELPEPPPEPDHADRASASVDIQRALMRVPVEYRSAVVLHDIQGMAYEDVAVILNIPIGTVKSRIHRGRVALGRALGSGSEPPVDPAMDPGTPERIRGEHSDTRSPSKTELP